jgi:Domain of unknown function (DUF4249)
MRRNFTKYIFGLIGLFLCSCIRNVSVPIRSVPPILVVEGWITTDPPPYSVNLSYSGKFTSTYQGGTDSSKEQFITNARVTIEDDLGDSTAFKWISNGTYQSVDSNFIGKVGRSYTLKMYLSNGKTYVSKPEKIAPVPSIDSVNVVYDSTFITDIRPTQLIVSVNTHDPPNVQNFYRWTALGYIPRKSVGDSCQLFAPACLNPYDCTCAALCAQLLNNDQINILSDQFIDGREILQQPVFYSPVYWYGRHFIEIKQYSISEQAYLFWEQYLTQTNRTGSILDPLPAPLIGNVYSQADSNDIALGLFSASAVFSKKIVISLFYPVLQEYLLESIAGEYIKIGECHRTYSNSLPDDTDPPGWENAEEIDLG